VPRVFISARAGEGMIALRGILSEAVGGTLEGFLNAADTPPNDIRLLDADRLLEGDQSNTGDDDHDAAPKAINHSLA
jgi:hypothetical protein